MGVKILLDVKNGSRALKPKAGDVMIFDGESWYITKKHDLFAEYEAKIDDFIQKANERLAKAEEFERETRRDVAKLGETIKTFVQLQETEGNL